MRRISPADDQQRYRPAQRQPTDEAHRGVRPHRHAQVGRAGQERPCRFGQCLGHHRPGIGEHVHIADRQPRHQALEPSDLRHHACQTGQCTTDQLKAGADDQADHTGHQTAAEHARIGEHRGVAGQRPGQDRCDVGVDGTVVTADECDHPDEQPHRAQYQDDAADPEFAPVDQPVAIRMKKIDHRHAPPLSIRRADGSPAASRPPRARSIR